MRKVQLIFLYLVLLFTSLACSPEEIEEQMVDFDRSFIPVWYYIEMDNYTQATLAFANLEEAWTEFRQTANPYTNNSRQWKRSLGQVDDWMATTSEAIQAEEKVLAINQLDHARYELMDWRWRWKMDYFLDKVWDLEASIDVAKSVAFNLTLDSEEWEQYQKANEDIRKSWEQLQLKQADPELHQLSAHDIQNLQIRHQELGDLIRAYLKEGQCMEACEYEDAIQSLHFAFLNYLKTFGDFTTIHLPPHDSLL